MLNNVAIIPARGGSKRIPRKNIKNFLGKPIISIAIEKAIQSNLFKKIIVSTDDTEIAQIANLYGASTPFIRPKNLSDDFMGTIEVISHAVNYLIMQGDIFDYACCLYPCSPLIEVGDLVDSYDLLKSKGDGFSFPATEYAASIYRSFKKTENDSLRMIYPEYYFTRTQDLEPVYHDAGQFYWGTTKAWTTSKRIFSNEAYPHIIPRWRVQDIDTEDDWLRTEIIYRAIEKMRM